MNIYNIEVITQWVGKDGTFDEAESRRVCGRDFFSAYKKVEKLILSKTRGWTAENDEGERIKVHPLKILDVLKVEQEDAYLDA